MNRFSIKCPGCLYPLPAEAYNSQEQAHTCPGCGVRVLVYAFPALYRHPEKISVGQEAALDEAACFYHAAKKAEQLCESCGRFLCGLCALPLGGEVLCASCLELKRKEPAGRHDLKPRQFRHDKLALGLAIVPLILYFPITIFTAPGALYVAIRYWRTEIDFAKGRKVRMTVALLFSGLETAAWLAALGLLIWSLTHG